MFTNKLNQLYKPERILFYKEADASVIASFRDGIPDEDISRYTNAFGTYDHPGLFFIRSLNRWVIGIEFRVDDERVRYPEGLESMVFEGNFFYSIEIDNEIEISRNPIAAIFEEIASHDDARRLSSYLKIRRDPEVIGVFIGGMGDKLRILHEWELVEDKARDILNDDVDQLDKKMLFRMAFFDSITGHYNWNHMVPCLEMPMDKGIKDYAFAHFDIKAFRIINEVYGHIAANRVLNNVVSAMNEADFIYASCRCHNDNFAMMIRDMPQEEMIERLESFFDELSYFSEDPNYKIYFRCGIVPLQRAILLGNRVADAGKMAQALGTSPGKTDIIVYTDKDHEDVLWSNYIKAYLDTAIEQDEFLVYLQPKFDIASERIKGAEALIRWRYRNEELLSPARFIPFFEKDGSIGKIDNIVLNKVCRALAKWKEEGRALYPVSVNLSRRQLFEANLTDRLEKVVDSYGVDHALIDFELTESATYDDKDHLLGVLNDLRDKGFKISMDDFGTGYSSLSLLTEMPLDTLKIDKSFVDKIGSDDDKEKDIVVIKHIISLAKELGFICLAEGAEEKRQVDRLRDLGCEVIQGYYYSRPIPMEEYEEKYL